MVVSMSRLLLVCSLRTTKISNFMTVMNNNDTFEIKVATQISL